DGVSDVAIPVSWGTRWLSWLERDRENETKLACENTLRLELEQRDVEEKLNKLLDGYLEEVIDPEIYKQKKNELFEQKLKLQEKIA
ncbi:hypothetical protein COY30_01520, partial [Candidatus Woesebacteria bacterium CG_4_10_14_0_2_um_filter_44_9]